MDLHSGLPYWIIKNPLYDYYNPLKKDCVVDVVIIGAGITGALVAHELLRAGLKCCVVDKRSIATGSSAASTALLQYELDEPLYRLIDKVGEEAAVTVYKACLQSISDLEQIIRETRIRTDFERVPSVFFASDDEGMATIEKEYEVRRKYNLPVEYADRRQLFRYSRFDAPAALINEVSAQIDTYKTATGLLRYDMREHGLEVYTHTDIKRWQMEGYGCELMTDKGYVIECEYVVIAAGFEAGPFLPEQVMKLTSTYALVSHPVDSRFLWPHRSLIWETSQPYLYIRTTEGNRIMVGGEDEDFSDPVRRDALLREKVRTLEKKFVKLFPHFYFTTEMAWCGTFSSTDDGLPYIGTWPRKDRMYFALGYGGNGITFSMIAAQVIRNGLKNVPDPRASVFGFNRKKAGAEA